MRTFTIRFNMSEMNGPATEQKRERNWKWTTNDTIKLIGQRKKFDEMFTGKRGSSLKGWKVVSGKMKIPGLDWKTCRKKWQNLSAKYKDLKYPQPGKHTGTNSCEATAASWPYFELMDEVVGKNEQINSNILIESSCDDIDNPKLTPPKINSPQAVPRDSSLSHIIKPLQSSDSESSLSPELLSTAFMTGIEVIMDESEPTTASEASRQSIRHDPALQSSQSTNGPSTSSCSCRLPCKLHKMSQAHREDKLLAYFKEQDKRAEEQNIELLGILKEFLAEYKRKK